MQMPWSRGIDIDPPAIIITDATGDFIARTVGGDDEAKATRILHDVNGYDTLLRAAHAALDARWRELYGYNSDEAWAKVERAVAGSRALRVRAEDG